MIYTVGLAEVPFTTQNPAGFGPWGFDSPPRHQHFRIAIVPTLNHSILPIRIPPPKIDQGRGPEPGEEPHFDQGNEENNLLGCEDGIIIKLLLRFTGGISK